MGVQVYGSKPAVSGDQPGSPKQAVVLPVQGWFPGPTHAYAWVGAVQ